MTDTSFREQEWLEADGLGGFASGTALGLRTRRYHALLLTATTPPTGRMALVKGVDAWVETGNDFNFLNPQTYYPNIQVPEKTDSLISFETDPWPRRVYKLSNGLLLEYEIFVPHGLPMVVLSFKLLSEPGSVRLSLRPLLAGCDYHSLHHENPNFNFDAQIFDKLVQWKPYSTTPVISAMHNGHYHHKPEWYYQFLYQKELERGLDYLEDLASPGLFQWTITKTRAVILFSANGIHPTDEKELPHVEELFESLRSAEEKRRKAFPSRLHRSADAYFVKRGKGKSLVAGYPWLTDWGRDTFVSLRGLGIATGRLEDSREILLEWSRKLDSQGMLPNHFPDQGEEPDYHSVDSALWFILAVREYELAHGKESVKELHQAVWKILEGYRAGVRVGIGLDTDGLLWSGEGNSSLTWMDARVHGNAVTPRVGKPVEVEALWLNALAFALNLEKNPDPAWKELFEKGQKSFREKFWYEEGGYLYDLVDRDRYPDSVDTRFRPNQIFAVGGLPLVLVSPDQARRVVEEVEKRLWTPVGLRTLAAGEPGYQPHYTGGVVERDSAYHQGPAWPWLAGPFVEAWLRARGGSTSAKAEARRKFLEPLQEIFLSSGTGHIPELYDGEEPYRPGGCPYQAWSLGELIRLEKILVD
jgi:predicted glycogen debranching enzyme